jgi:DNA-binding response OmpR family regulator
VARVKAVLRRSDGAPPPEVVQAGRVKIDAGRREVRVDDTVIELTTKEFDLLRFLAERAGLVMSRKQILDGVWGYDWYGDPRTVDVHIAQVRKKVGDGVEIRTVRGVGYRLEPDAPHAP